MMPVPIIIPFGGGCYDTSEGRRIFIDINQNFERIKYRIESITKKVYREDDSYLTSDGLIITEDIWVESCSGVIASSIYGAFTLLTFFLMNHSSWKAKDNIFNEIWEWAFHYIDGEFFIAAVIFVSILVAIFFGVGIIAARIIKTQEVYIKEMDISENPNNTIISFTLDDNMDFEFYRELLKEFKIGDK